MGVARCNCNALLVEAGQRPFYGSVLQLGKCDIYFGIKELESWASRWGVRLSRVDKIGAAKNPYYPNLECLDDTTFFSLMGFRTVHSCDASGFESATYIFDLNHPVAESFHNRYDAIFDGGTSEHVFDLMSVLKNVHSMLRVGGRIIHGLPVNNYVDHGFYQFSPTALYDYYQANRYVINTFLVTASKQDHFAESAFYRYEPGILDAHGYGGFTKEPFKELDLIGLFFCATKTDLSVSGIIPQQSFYQRAWKQAGAGHEQKKLELSFCA